MKTKEIRQKVFEPVEVAKGVFIAGKHLKDYQNGFIKNFDINGRLISQYSNQPSYNSTTEFIYDERDNLTAEKVFSEDTGDLYRQTIYTYNDSNLLIRKEDKMADGDSGEPSYTNHEYDAMDRLVFSEHFRSGKFLYSESFSYDKTGLQKELIQRNLNQEITKHSLIISNEKGQNLEVRTRDRLSVDERVCHYTYDEYDKLVELKFFRGGDMESREVWNYDQNNNLVSKKRFMSSQKGLVSNEVYVYEYDEIHQWTSRTYYLDGEIESITEREVIFYKE